MRLPRVSCTLQEVRNSSYLGLFSIFFWLEMVDVRVSFRRPSPRRTVLRLIEDMELPQEERGLCLGRGCVRLGEGVHLGEGMYA